MTEKLRFYKSDLQKAIQMVYSDKYEVVKAKLDDGRIVEYTECVELMGFRNILPHERRFSDSQFLGEGYIYSVGEVIQSPFRE